MLIFVPCSEANTLFWIRYNLRWFFWHRDGVRANLVGWTLAHCKTSTVRCYATACEEHTSTEIGRVRASLTWRAVQLVGRVGTIWLSVTVKLVINAGSVMTAKLGFITPASRYCGKNIEQSSEEQWRRLYGERGARAPLPLLQMAGHGGHRECRRTANEKLTKLCCPPRKRSPKRIIVLVEPKKSGGARPKIF